VQVGVLVHVGQRRLHHRAHAQLVDAAHVVTSMPRVLTKLFDRVHAAHANQGDLLGLQGRCGAGQLRQLRRPMAEQAGHRHAVQVAAG
jgi:hypothetical protein